jgi:hypothetical protein
MIRRLSQILGTSGKGLGKIVNARRGGEIRVAHPSRVLALASRQCELLAGLQCPPLNSNKGASLSFGKSLFRRDAETSRRDACATRMLAASPLGCPETIICVHLRNLRIKHSL